MNPVRETTIPAKPEPVGAPARRHPQHAARRGSARWPLVIGAVVVVVVLLVVGILRHLATRRAQEQFADATAETVVNVQVAHGNPKPVDLVLPGSVQANQATTLYARSNGFLGKWLVDIGDNVKQGQTLAIIETPDLDQQLRQAESTLNQAKANAQIAHDTAVRWQDLYREKVVSAQDNDQNQSAYRAAAAAQAAAEATMDQLKQEVAFNQIIAPFDGRITNRYLDVGALVSAGSGAAGTAIYDLAQTDPLRIYVYVPQTDAPLIHLGGTARLLVREHPDRDFIATVTRTAGAIDPASRTLLTELQIPNKDGALYSGMYAEAEFVLKDTSAAPIIVTANAFQFGTAGPQVVVVRDGKIHWQAIQVGRDFGTDLEVLLGLHEGDLVVVNPTDDLVEGLPVKAQTIPPPSPTPAQGTAGH